MVCSVVQLTKKRFKLEFSQAKRTASKKAGRARTVAFLSRTTWPSGFLLALASSAVVAAPTQKT